MKEVRNDVGKQIVNIHELKKLKIKNSRGHKSDNVSKMKMCIEIMLRWENFNISF